MLTPTKFTIYPDTQTGDVYGTEFTFTTKLTSDHTAYTWDFGDGSNAYNSSVVTHTYKFPGSYGVSLSAWTNTGQLETDFAAVEVDYAFRDAIKFSYLPTELGLPGLSGTTPFTISLTSSRIEEQLAVVLQSYNSRSVPYFSVPEKWRFLAPTWRFYDARNPYVPLQNGLLLSSVPIYKNGKIVGTKAEGSFYYIDDLPTIEENGCPLLIVATLSTENFVNQLESSVYPYSSYSNSKVAAAAATWQINTVIPERLSITENYLSDVYPMKWADVPIPLLLTCETNIEETPTLDLSYPKTNELGSLSPVVVYLSSNNISQKDLKPHYEVNQNLYFKRQDSLNNRESGYIFTNIVPQSGILTLSSYNANTTFVIAASTVTNQGIVDTSIFSFPIGYTIFSEQYVSHPIKSSISKFNLVPYPINCGYTREFKANKSLAEGSQISIKVPSLTSTDTFNYTISGIAGIYGLAFNPDINVLYTVDADQNIITSYSSGTELLTSVQLSSFMNGEILAPSHITIDKPGNVWVSLYDDKKLIKFDSNLNYLLSTAPSYFGVGTPPYEYAAPPVVETDKMNNVWACYADVNDSLLVKFDTNGNEIARATNLPGESFPVSLAIDVHNNVWVACKKTHSVMQFDEDGQMISSITAFASPSYIAIDRHQVLWVLHGYNLCSAYDTKTSELTTWRVDTVREEIIKVVDYDEDLRYLSDDEIWGGLAVDVYDRKWLINSTNNTIIRFEPETPRTLAVYCLNPLTDTQHVIHGEDRFVSQEEANRNVRSAQASGDWTGNRWYQKYAYDRAQTLIYGTSTPFKLYNINSGKTITKVNEDFNFASHLKSLALPEILNNNFEFFDTFLASFMGNGNPFKETLGTSSYEKISNFVSNHADYETANIPQMLSIADQLSVNYKDYARDVPLEVQRLLNLFSIPKQRLRGYENFVQDVPDQDEENLLTETSTITANTYYLIKDKIYRNYSLLYTEPLSSATGIFNTYLLSSLEVDSLRSPVYKNYHVYTYNPYKSEGYIGNLVNWSSPYTTVDYTLSTDEQWYGDGGLVETMFNNLLTKQLYLQ